MSFTKLIDFSDKKIRDELGDYYIVPKTRLENIETNLNKLKNEKQELKDLLQNFIEISEWRHECSLLYSEMYVNYFSGSYSLPIDSIYHITRNAEDEYEEAIETIKQYLDNTDPYLDQYTSTQVGKIILMDKQS